MFRRNIASAVAGLFLWRMEIYHFLSFGILTGRNAAFQAKHRPPHDDSRKKKFCVCYNRYNLQNFIKKEFF
jgi:hypothetical protein